MDHCVRMPVQLEAFGAKEGDPMWRKPEDRTVIWQQIDNQKNGGRK